MAIISKYPYDIVIQDKDAWIGTEASNRQTKQYTAEALANYLNTNGKVSIGGQLTYKFHEEPYITTGSFSLPLGNGDETPFSDISSIIIYNRDIDNQYVVSYVNYLIGQEILISSQKDVSSFGHYKISSFTQDVNFPNYYILNLISIGGNGVLYLNNIYDIVNFTFGSESDKTFEFTQLSPSTSWNITHNLLKFPSITVIDSANTVVVGEYTYIDNNNVILTFSAGFAGKAYLN
jgi:hypothetical protein